MIFPSKKVHATDYTKETGYVLQILIPATALALTYAKGDNQGSIQFYKSFATTMAATYALKYSVPETRPDGTDNKSFISGHTSAAFSGASFIQRRYGWKLGIVAYAAASFTGWSRIESKKHYLGDVARGAAIGIISTYIFTSPYNGVTIQAFADRDTYGINLLTSW